MAKKRKERSLKNRLKKKYFVWAVEKTTAQNSPKYKEFIKIMAKKKTFPKSPKQSASLESWQKYDKKVAEVKKHNSQVESDSRKKKSLIEKTKKAKSSK